MKVSPPIETHDDLFPSVLPQGKIKSLAHGRNLVGRFTEEILVRMLGLTRCHQSGNYDLCFDAAQDGRYKEIKALKRGRSLAIYAWRLEKEILCPETDYLIMLHDTSLSGVDTMEKLAQGLLSSESQVLSIPITLLAPHIKATCRLEKHSPASLAKLTGCNHGNARGHYADGFYRIQEPALRDAFAWEHGVALRGKVYGKKHFLSLWNAVRAIQARKTS